MYKKLGMAALAGAALYGGSGRTGRGARLRPPGAAQLRFLRNDVVIEQDGNVSVGWAATQNYSRAFINGLVSSGLFTFSDVDRDAINPLSWKDARREWVDGGHPYPMIHLTREGREVARSLADYSGSGRRAKASDPNVTAGKLQFWRGSLEGKLDPGRGAFFSSNESFARGYGPIKAYRLYLRNPKFVTQDQWTPFQSDVQKFLPGARKRAQQKWQTKGHDGVVWAFTPLPGADPLYSVYAFDGAKAVKKLAKRRPKRRSTAPKISWGSTMRPSKKFQNPVYQFGSLLDMYYLFALEREVNYAYGTHMVDGVGIYRLTVAGTAKEAKDPRARWGSASTLGIGPLQEMRNLAQDYVDAGGGPMKWTRANWDKWHEYEWRAKKE